MKETQCTKVLRCKGTKHIPFRELNVAWQSWCAGVCVCGGVGLGEQRVEAEKIVWGRLGRTLHDILKGFKGFK